MPIINPYMLRTIPLFELLDTDELTALAQQLDQKHFWAGEKIFSMGDQGGTMCVVHSGRVELFIKDRNNEHVCLGYVEKGEIFGELSLLDNQMRSASAIATEETLLFIVDRHDLQMLIKSHPDAALDMMQMLGQRIREADRLVGERVVARNPNEEMPAPRTIGERLSDVLTMVAGDIRFVYFNFLWFAIWMTINLGLIPNLQPFDPFPFGLLTMIVSLEAIFLSLFVLISQNRQAARDKIRNDIEYDVNIKAELEIRDLRNKVDDMQELLINHLTRMNTNIEESTKLQTGQLKTVQSDAHHG